jgi:SRSO17 transposase
MPFLDALGDKRRRRWAPLYVMGLLLPGDRKSMQPISSRVAPQEVEQIHHFVGTSCWDTVPVEEVLWEKADSLLGGDTSYLIVDDTSLPKKGTESVGVAHQYCGALGKQANCQCLVSLTLGRNDVFMPVCLRLYLPQAWTNEPTRCERAKVPATIGYRPKWQIALDEIDRMRAAGLRFGSALADAGYGMCAEFRHGLSERGLSWAVGILSTQNMYFEDVKVTMPPPKRTGRPRIHPTVGKSPCSAERFIEKHGTFRRVVWRKGTKGPLFGDFAIMRVRPADATQQRDGVHLPGQPAWLVCERLSNGDRKYYLANLPASCSRKRIVATIKARWACEQGHQQMKEELGLDHFEGRSWWGLHHHAVLTMIAFAFLQTLRLSENKFAA